MQKSLKHLQLIFWGALLVLIDFHISSTSNGFGIKVDIFNDLIGAIMVCYGIVGLSKTPISSSSYRPLIRFTIIASVAQIFLSAYEFIIYDAPEFLTLIVDILGLFICFGMIMFCKSMVIFSEERQLYNSKKRWKKTKKLILWLNLIPFIFFKLINWVNLFVNIDGFEWQLESVLGPMFILVLTIILLFIPAVYTLITIHNMRKEIRHLNW